MDRPTDSTGRELDLLRDTYAGFSRGEMPALFDDLHGRSGWHADERLSRELRYVGPEAVCEALHALSRPWEEFVLETHELHEPEPGLVVVVGTIAGRLRRSGQVMAAGFVHEVSFRRGKVAELRVRLSRDAELLVGAA